MTPMHHSWNDQPIDVGENFVERFAVFGWVRRQRSADRARLIVRRDAQLLDPLAIIRDLVGKLMQLLAKFFRRRIAWQMSILH